MEDKIMIDLFDIVYKSDVAKILKDLEEELESITNFSIENDNRLEIFRKLIDMEKHIFELRKKFW